MNESVSCACPASCCALNGSRKGGDKLFLFNFGIDLELTRRVSLALYLKRMTKVARVNWFVESVQPLRALMVAVEGEAMHPVRNIM